MKDDEKATKDNQKSRILIVDDHPMMRQGLIEVLDGEPDLEVCGEAGDISSAMQKAETLGPDLVLVDIVLKEESGLDLIQRLKSQYPEMKILVLSMHDEVVYAERGLRAGALGYVNKSEPPDKLIEAIRTVMSGETALGRDMTDVLVKRAIRGGSEEPHGVESLSDRELEIFQLIGKGLSVRDIADRLCVSVKTVETHREHIKVKLGLDTAAALLRYATLWLSTASQPESR